MDRDEPREGPDELKLQARELLNPEERQSLTDCMKS